MHDTLKTLEARRNLWAKMVQFTLWAVLVVCAYLSGSWVLLAPVALLGWFVLDTDGR